jgi:hypothetical protein
MSAPIDIAPAPRSPRHAGNDFSHADASSTQVFLALVPHVINPIQLAIVEAMAWIKRPLSATQLSHVLRGLGGKKGTYPGLLSYHLRAMLDFQVLEVAGTRSVRGTTETFFFFRMGD